MSLPEGPMNDSVPDQDVQPAPKLCPKRPLAELNPNSDEGKHLQEPLAKKPAAAPLASSALDPSQQPALAKQDTPRPIGQEGAARHVAAPAAKASLTSAATTLPAEAEADLAQRLQQVGQLFLALGREGNASRRHELMESSLSLLQEHVGSMCVGMSEAEKVDCLKGWADLAIVSNDQELLDYITS